MKKVVQEAVASRPEPYKAKRLILYVEDEKENFDVAELRLRNRYQLLWAPDDVTACRLAKEHAGELLAVLMDIQLKGSTLDGTRITQLFRGTLPAGERPAFAAGAPTLTCPIIFVTAFGRQLDEATLSRVGGDRVIPKPVDFVELMTCIAQCHTRTVLERSRPAT